MSAYVTLHSNVHIHHCRLLLLPIGIVVFRWNRSLAYRLIINELKQNYPRDGHRGRFVTCEINSLDDIDGREGGMERGKVFESF